MAELSFQPSTLSFEPFEVWALFLLTDVGPGSYIPFYVR
jgi:hypothetical protein